MLRVSQTGRLSGSYIHIAEAVRDMRGGPFMTEPTTTKTRGCSPAELRSLLVLSFRLSTATSGFVLMNL